MRYVFVDESLEDYLKYVVHNKTIGKKVVSSIKNNLHKWNLVNNYKPNRDESY
ncbi:hypothetical protein RCH18_001822 [Flavobacterium sp. PL11]|uniref:hypothetical protein n=1 Tax=Flavobacterium sp. PL11 TaxID=3071717 RepID=UPI002E03BB6D|nr:hypothetical protein [Flavobacterium sp. PL11]